MYVFKLGAVLAFDYVNYKGNDSRRNVVFIGLDYGSNEWYPDDQWFMRCFDLDKNAYRSFALNKINPRAVNIVSP